MSLGNVVSVSINKNYDREHMSRFREEGLAGSHGGRMSEQVTIQVECPCGVIFRLAGESDWVTWRIERWIELHARNGCAAFPGNT